MDALNYTLHKSREHCYPLPSQYVANMDIKNMNLGQVRNKLMAHGFKASIDKRGDRLQVGTWKSLYRFTVRYHELSNTFKLESSRLIGPLNIMFGLFGVWQLISVFFNTEGGEAISLFSLLLAPLIFFSLLIEVLRFLFQPSAERTALNIINTYSGEE
ncbi:hypothetical protein GV054_19625 [Marinomonas mediterranea]|uniref:hypothetical protein n=1 Tax=Marinomonas mediterranea TaxID=119864 RepID=UPI00234B4254|nr:hypothetical protein [Marinomonas mediterranea]WCN15062.1 hypothetical protein GV054_19625 [Marinomonas mediterranea]